MHESISSKAKDIKVGKQQSKAKNPVQALFAVSHFGCLLLG